MMARRRRRGPSVGDWIIAIIIGAILLSVFVAPLRSRVSGAVRAGAEKWGVELPWGGGSSGGGAPWPGIPLPGGDPVEALPESEAAQELKALVVRDSESGGAPEYQRSEFGQAWADEDRNGCDTRNDILARDLARASFKEGTRGCVVLSGVLAEPYTGSTIEFQRGQDTSALVQIDHVVALGDAWRSGAWQWDAASRQSFANDPENLLAVDGQANQDKKAASADEWMPPDSGFHCEYATRQIGVKAKWGLSVTAAERAALARALAACG